MFVMLCYVMRTSPHKHRVCAALFPRFPLNLVRLCLLCYVMRTSPHKHRVCAALFPRFPLNLVRLCLLCYVMRTSPHKHQVCAVLFPRLPFQLVRLCISICYTCFASRIGQCCNKRSINKLLFLCSSARFD